MQLHQRASVAPPVEEVVNTLVARKGKSKKRPLLSSVGPGAPMSFGRKSMSAMDSIPSSGGLGPWRKNTAAR